MRQEPKRPRPSPSTPSSPSSEPTEAQSALGRDEPTLVVAHDDDPTTRETIPSLITTIEPGPLATTTSLEAFFFERLHGHAPGVHEDVTNAIDSTTPGSAASAGSTSTTSLDPEVGAYLVQVLVAWARRVGAAGRKSPALAIEFMEARARDVQALRRVGDRALCIAGIVPRSMTRSPVNLDYVSAIGRSAYSIAAQRTRTHELFTALAERFDELADRLGEAAAPEGLTGGLDSLLDAYGRWQRSRTGGDGARLMAAGVVVSRGGVGRD